MVDVVVFVVFCLFDICYLIFYRILVYGVWRVLC